MEFHLEVLVRIYLLTFKYMCIYCQNIGGIVDTFLIIGQYYEIESKRSIVSIDYRGVSPLLLTIC